MDQQHNRYSGTYDGRRQFNTDYAEAYMRLPVSYYHHFTCSSPPVYHSGVVEQRRPRPFQQHFTSSGPPSASYPPDRSGYHSPRHPDTLDPCDRRTNSLRVTGSIGYEVRHAPYRHTQTHYDQTALPIDRDPPYGLPTRRPSPPSPDRGSSRHSTTRPRTLVSRRPTPSPPPHSAIKRPRTLRTFGTAVEPARLSRTSSSPHRLLTDNGAGAPKSPPASDDRSLNRSSGSVASSTGKRLATSKTPRGPTKIRRPSHEEIVFWDPYCWLCHSLNNKSSKRNGHATLECLLCPRSFHKQCLSTYLTRHTDFDYNEVDFACPECQTISLMECAETRSGRPLITIERLNKFLVFAMQRMRLIIVASKGLPNIRDLCPVDADFIVSPLSFSDIERKIKHKAYASTDSFLADIKWLYHNAAIYFGSQNNGSSGSLSRTGTDPPANLILATFKKVEKVCAEEMAEITTCPGCYQNAYSKDDWFSCVCSPVHTLVWAKVKGFPYWPGKALRTYRDSKDGPAAINGLVMIDVRFFGKHDRSWVPINNCFLLSHNSPFSGSKPPKRLPSRNKRDFEDSLRELGNHIVNIETWFDCPFPYAPDDAPLPCPTEPTASLDRVDPLTYLDWLLRNPRSRHLASPKPSGTGSRYVYTPCPLIPVPLPEPGDDVIPMAVKNPTSVTKADERHPLTKIEFDPDDELNPTSPVPASRDDGTGGGGQGCDRQLEIRLTPLKVRTDGVLTQVSSAVAPRVPLVIPAVSQLPPFDLTPAPIPTISVVKVEPLPYDQEPSKQIPSDSTPSVGSGTSSGAPVISASSDLVEGAHAKQSEILETPPTPPHETDEIVQLNHAPATQTQTGPPSCSTECLGSKIKVEHSYDDMHHYASPDKESGSDAHFASCDFISFDLPLAPSSPPSDPPTPITNRSLSTLPIKGSPSTLFQGDRGVSDLPCPNGSPTDHNKSVASTPVDSAVTLKLEVIDGATTEVAPSTIQVPSNISEHEHDLKLATAPPSSPPRPRNKPGATDQKCILAGLLLPIDSEQECNNVKQEPSVEPSPITSPKLNVISTAAVVEDNHPDPAPNIFSVTHRNCLGPLPPFPDSDGGLSPLASPVTRDVVSHISNREVLSVKDGLNRAFLSILSSCRLNSNATHPQPTIETKKLAPPLDPVPTLRDISEPVRVIGGVELGAQALLVESNSSETVVVSTQAALFVPLIVPSDGVMEIVEAIPTPPETVVKNPSLGRASPIPSSQDNPLLTEETDNLDNVMGELEEANGDPEDVNTEPGADPTAPSPYDSLLCTLDIPPNCDAIVDVVETDLFPSTEFVTTATPVISPPTVVPGQISTSSVAPSCDLSSLDDIDVSPYISQIGDILRNLAHRVQESVAKAVVREPPRPPPSLSPDPDMITLARHNNIVKCVNRNVHNYFFKRFEDHQNHHQESIYKMKLSQDLAADSLAQQNQDLRDEEARLKEEAKALEEEKDRLYKELSDSAIAIQSLRDDLDEERTQATLSIEAIKRKQWCVNCLKEAIFYCCVGIWYCGPHCQKEHWTVHKDVCKEIRRNLVPESPHGNDSDEIIILDSPMDHKVPKSSHYPSACAQLKSRTLQNMCNSVVTDQDYFTPSNLVNPSVYSHLPGGSSSGRHHTHQYPPPSTRCGLNDISQVVGSHNNMGHSLRDFVSMQHPHHNPAASIASYAGIHHYRPFVDANSAPAPPLSPNLSFQHHQHLFFGPVPRDTPPERHRFSDVGGGRPGAGGGTRQQRQGRFMTHGSDGPLSWASYPTPGRPCNQGNDARSSFLSLSTRYSYDHLLRFSGRGDTGFAFNSISKPPDYNPQLQRYYIPNTSAPTFTTDDHFGRK